MLQKKYFEYKLNVSYIIKIASALEDAEKLRVSKNLKQPQPLANESPPSSGTVGVEILAADQAIYVP